MSRTIALVTPVLDDWGSLAALLTDISGLFIHSGISFRVYAVDDGSSAPFEPAGVVLPSNSCIASIEVIRLAVNLGHQRAIAIGLCASTEGDDIDDVLVMDSDGQDRPIDIAALLAASQKNPTQIVFAHRTKRSEPPFFRLWYCFYKLMFRLLTGQPISFGNFCLVPREAVDRLVHMPELWNNLAAAIMRSRLPYQTVPTARGVRLSGRSRLGFSCLVIHALSAMSVHIDRIFARMLITAGFIAGLASLGIVAVGAIRIAGDLAIPGWATTAVGDLLIILFQTLVILIVACLTMLAGRSSRPMVPIVDFRPFVARCQRFRFGRGIAAPATAEAA